MRTAICNGGGEINTLAARWEVCGDGEVVLMVLGQMEDWETIACSQDTHFTNAWLPEALARGTPRMQAHKSFSHEEAHLRSSGARLPTLQNSWPVIPYPGPGRPSPKSMPTHMNLAHGIIPSSQLPSVYSQSRRRFPLLWAPLHVLICEQETEGWGNLHTDPPRHALQGRIVISLGRGSLQSLPSVFAALLFDFIMTRW